jgi:hypothetical protein
MYRSTDLRWPVSGLAIAPIVPTLPRKDEQRQRQRIGP